MESPQNTIIRFIRYHVSHLRKIVKESVYMHVGSESYHLWGCAYQRINNGFLWEKAGDELYSKFHIFLDYLSRFPKK